MKREGGEKIEKGEKKVCYILEGTNENIALDDDAEDDNETVKYIDPKGGPVEVFLSWNSEYGSTIDMDLSVAGPGEKDIDDVRGVSLEHYYIESDRQMYPGDIYKVSATGHQNVKDSRGIPEVCLEKNPVEIYTSILTPGDRKVFMVEAKTFAQLDLGPIADIVITEKKLPEVVEIEEREETQLSMGTGHDYGHPSGGEYESSCSESDHSCHCVPCEYEVRAFDPGVELGPISGAEVQIVKASEYATDAAAVYHGMTTVSDDLFKAGMIKLTAEDKEKFVDDEYYVVLASGGVDLDSNDDFIKDDIPTRNNGTVHAIIKGSDLKNVQFRVNALTEIVFQVSTELIGEQYNANTLEEHLDSVSKKILKQKTFIIDERLDVCYRDILLWVPTVFKSNLFKSYDLYVEPIIQKLYANEDRLQESYDFVYQKVNENAPELYAFSAKISQKFPSGAIIGKMHIRAHGDSNITEIRLFGNGAENFIVDEKGVMYVSQDANLSLQTYYKLRAEAINESGYRSARSAVIIKIVENPNITVVTGSVPYAVELDIENIKEDIEPGSIIGNVKFVDTNYDITSLELIGGGDDIEIDANGNIKIADKAHIDYEKVSEYPLSISALNSIGNRSLPVVMTVEVTDVIDTPAYKLFFSKHVEENVEIGTVLGQLEKVREGIYPVDAIHILNKNVPFYIDVNGTVYVNGEIDYERKDEYNLIAFARTKGGDSNRINLNIYVDDVLESPGKVPSITDFKGYVNRDAKEGTLVGYINIFYYEYGNPVESIKLSGIGSRNFNIDKSGIITVAKNAYFGNEEINFYAMKAVATNKYGASNEADIVVGLNTTVDTGGTTRSQVLKIELFENIDVNSIIGRVNNVEPSDTIVLSGDEGEQFRIDSRGYLFIDKPLDYETQKYYRLQAQIYHGSELKWTANIHINILNVKDNLEMTSDTKIYVKEDMIPGSQIGDLGIIDLYKNRIEKIIVRNIDNTSDIDFFSINRQGEVFLTQSINYEERRNYHFEAIVFTDSNISETIEVEVEVLNVVERPYFHEPRVYGYIDGIRTEIPTKKYIDISENIAINSIVGYVDVLNNDDNITSFRIEGEDSDVFTITENGEVVLLKELDYETKRQYVFDLFAINSVGKNDDHAQLYINVKNIKDEADLLREIQFSVEENTSIGTTLGKVKFSADIDANLSDFRLRGEDENLFDIDQNGSITLAQQLDYEVAHHHIVDILASKNGNMIEAVNMKVTVLDTADISPVIEDLNSSIEENATEGTEVGRIKISNSGDSEITSFVLSGEGNENFTIDLHGMIRLASNATLDYEKQKKYTVSAKAINSAGESEPCTVMIDINDTGVAPVLLSTTIVIEDARDAGNEVGNIIVGDDGDSPIIEMKLTGEGAEEFKVDEKGVVSLVSSYSQDFAREYNLLVTANNKFGNSDPVEINIIIKPNASSVTAGSNITVLEHQAFSLQGKVGETNTTEVLSYQWYSPDTNKIDCDGDSHECLVSGLEIGEYEAIFSVIYKNGEKHDDSIMIKVINNPLNNILGTLQEGLEGLKEMKLSKDSTKMYVIGDFEDDIVFKIVDVSDVKEMKIISTYANSNIGNDVSSFALNEDENKVAIVGGSVIVLDISDPIAIKYISGRSSHATRLVKLVQWYKDNEILIYNYNSWSEPYYTILLFDIYQMNSGAIKEFVLDTYPRDFLVVSNEDILVVAMSNKLKVYDINKSTMLYETDKVWVDNIVLSKGNSKVYYNYGYSNNKIAGLDISNKTVIKDINLSEKTIFDYQSLYDVNDSSDTLYTYSNSYSTINKINIQDFQHQYIGDTTYINGRIQQVEAIKDQKSAFVYSDNGLQVIDIKKSEYKGRLIDNLNTGYLDWSHYDSYAYASGFIYDCGDIFNITNIGKFSALNSCYPDCGEGEEGGSSSLMLSYFYLSSDDSQISFMYTDTNGEKKYASIDVSDKKQNNFIQLDENDPWENVSRFTISKNERYVYTGYKEEDVNGISYFGIMVLDRDTQDKQYFRVGEDEGKEFTHFALSNNEEKLYVLLDGSVIVFDIQNNKKITAMNYIVSPSIVNAFTLGTNQNKIFALTESGLDIIDTSNSKIIYHYATPEKPKNLSLSPNGIKLAISMGNVVEIVNVINQEELTRYGFIWYPSFSYGSGNVLFKSNSILFSEGYIIDLEE